jgi:two-component system NarL family response regulator
MITDQRGRVDFGTSSRWETVIAKHGPNIVGRGILPSGAPLLVEEKPICRLAILAVVAQVADLGPASVAATASEALCLLSDHPTSLLLVDLFSIGFDFEALRQLSQATVGPTIAIDDRLNPSFAALAQMAGAQGYVSKDCELDRFRAVIRVVIEGGEHFPREAAQVRRGNRAGGVLGLSPRQLDVLKCIAVGMSNADIARALGITAGTVKLHIHAILRLTGARNRTEAALIAGRFLAPTIGA